MIHTENRPSRRLMICGVALPLTFRSIVADNHAWKSTALGDLVQLAGDTFTRERVIDHSGQTLPAEVVNDAQDTKVPAINQGIRDEVQAPALIGAPRDRHRREVVRFV